ncbi:isoaspartyl peptidase/L-asparaginase [Cryomorphaceae bacterium 1068]|nr:isoaspartyl peptidase/L-asparaginase [Cryomorphaceae bacterium 1068]
MNRYSLLRIGILVQLCSILCVPLNCSAQERIPAIVIHGGAGTIKKGLLSDSLELEIRSSLQAALDSGYAVLDRGGSAKDAVVKAIIVLENAPHFNAGKGAVMNAEGNHELDASIMIGSEKNAGAIAGATTIKNPILGAIAVMENTPHVLLAGDGADLLAKEIGLEQVENSYFTTERIKSKWERSQSDVSNSEFSKFGTVGAVAIDKEGNIAAGTSTGGMMNKQYNRIGDSPIIGAGTYADNATCGVSCTGHGEYFIRVGVAKEISAQMEFGDKSLEESVNFTLHERLSGMNAGGGVIAIDKDGNIVMDFNTEGMYRGFKKGNESKVSIYGND